MAVSNLRENIGYWQERVDLAAAFRWTARLNLHEGVANHFSFATNESGTRFLMNPNQMHFARIKAATSSSLTPMILIRSRDQTPPTPPLGPCTVPSTATVLMQDV